VYGFDDILLDVEDKEISRVQYVENTFECRYKIMAKHLLDSIHFMNDGLKGAIILQTSDVAEEVNNVIVKSKFVSEHPGMVYRVMENFNVSSYYNIKVLDVYVRRWQILDGIGAEYFSELCQSKVK
jgi:hypothetical protein